MGRTVVFKLVLIGAPLFLLRLLNLFYSGHLLHVDIYFE